MAATITADEVRYRLRTMVTAEVSDTLLASASYISLAGAWLDQVLSNSNTDYDSLSATRQILAKAAQIDRCAWVVLAGAPKEAFKAGLTDFKGLDADLLEQAMGALRKEWTELLDLCGATTIQVGGSWSGGDDYEPDASSETNIHWTDTESEGFSRFG